MFLVLDIDKRLGPWGKVGPLSLWWRIIATRILNWISLGEKGEGDKGGREREREREKICSSILHTHSS